MIRAAKYDDRRPVLNGNSPTRTLGWSKNLSLPSLSTPSYYPCTGISRVSPRPRPAHFPKKSAFPQKVCRRRKNHRASDYLSFPGDVKIPETPRHSLPSGISREKTWFTIEEKHASSPRSSSSFLSAIVKYSISKGVSREKDQNDGF